MFKRNNAFKGGGEKRFGGRDSKPRFGGGFGPTQMYPAVCAKCERQCEVPFRPNGSKPTYCRDCFQQEGGAQRDGFEQRGFEQRGFDRPRFSEPRRTFAASQPSGDRASRQMDEMNAKLDRILREIEALKQFNA